MPGGIKQMWLPSLSLTAQALGKGKFLFVFMPFIWHFRLLPSNQILSVLRKFRTSSAHLIAKMTEIKFHPKSQSPLPPALYYGGGMNWVNSLLKTVSINAPKRLKALLQHCKLLNYLNWNLGSAQQIDDEDTIWDLRAQSAHCRTISAGPETKKHHTDRQPGDNSNRSLRNSQVKGSILKLKLHQFMKVRKARLC